LDEYRAPERGCRRAHEDHPGCAGELPELQAQGPPEARRAAGARCDYESLPLGLRGRVKSQAGDALRTRHPGSQTACDLPITPEALGREWRVILDGILEDDEFSILLDGLKREDGRSNLGDFHYIPVLCHEIRKATRVLLEVCGLLLEQVQGVAPRYGVIWPGPECTPTRVRLSGHRRMAERILAGVRELARSGTPPGLILNNHCQVCEFREPCHTWVVQEDSLSLLLGMGEKEIGAYNRKGFFTVTQLSHTFRYRKPRKREESCLPPTTTRCKPGPSARGSFASTAGLRSRRHQRGCTSTSKGSPTGTSTT
jgi:predicted RecB family nuclease